MVPRAARQTIADADRAASNGAHDGALALHKSPAQLRLETLQQEHDRLLREIGKKRTAFAVLEREARDAASELAAKVLPLRERYLATLEKLRAIFEGLLGEHSHLNKRDKARVRRVYARLLPGLAGDSDGDGHASDVQEEDAQAPPGRWPSGDDSGEAGYSASKPNEKNAGLLRSLFRKLAVALHPDKVQDEKERATLTSIMKEVTHAYESGDVARLVEIERTWLAQAPVPERELDVARRIAELLAGNKELRRQLRALTAELKELKQSSIGLSAPKRRGRASPRSEVDEMVSHLERDLAELETVRNFAQRFADGEIGITEFLLGPEPPDGEDDPFEQMLAEVLEAMAAEAPRARKARGRRRQKR